MRQLKREVKIGNVTIGGKNPIAVQTMLNVPVEDIEGNVAQAKRCEAAGCQILRVTCPSAADAKCIEAVKNAVNIPIVADIHFDYKAAIACADAAAGAAGHLYAAQFCPAGQGGCAPGCWPRWHRITRASSSASTIFSAMRRWMKPVCGK